MTPARRDEELLDVLGRALSPPFAEPPPDDLARLHFAVATTRPLERRQPARARWAIGAAAVLGFSVMGAGVAAATGATLPTPLRTAALAIGLPVDDVQLAETHADMARLRQALARRQDEGITAAAAELRRCLSRMDHSDWAEVQPAANQLLQQAATTLAAPGPGPAEDRPASGPAIENHGDSGEARSGGVGSAPVTTTAVSEEGSASSGDQGTGATSTTAPRGGDGGSSSVATTAPTTATTTPTSSDGTGDGGDGPGSTTTTTTNSNDGAGSGDGGSSGH